MITIKMKGTPKLVAKYRDLNSFMTAAENPLYFGETRVESALGYYPGEGMPFYEGTFFHLNAEDGTNKSKNNIYWVNDHLNRLSVERHLHIKVKEGKCYPQKLTKLIEFLLFNWEEFSISSSPLYETAPETFEVEGEEYRIQNTLPITYTPLLNSWDKNVALKRAKLYRDLT